MTTKMQATGDCWTCDFGMNDYLELRCGLFGRTIMGQKEYDPVAEHNRHNYPDNQKSITPPEWCKLPVTVERES